MSRWPHLSRQDVLWLVVIPIIILAAIIGPAYVAKRQSELELHLTCQTVVANVAELHALKSIAKELGLPARFEIPPVPESCDDYLP